MFGHRISHFSSETKAHVLWTIVLNTYVVHLHAVCGSITFYKETCVVSSRQQEGAQKNNACSATNAQYNLIYRTIHLEPL